MPVNYISSVKNVFELCPQYEKTLIEMQKKKPFSYEDSAILNHYLAYAQRWCFLEMDALSGRVAQIKDAEPLVELAKKMDRASAPFVQLCKEGMERRELQKKNPEEGPRLRHWFAMHFNELNSAILQHKGDKESLISNKEIKEAIRKISYFQKELEKLPKEQVAEQVEQLSHLCNLMVQDADPKGIIRNDLVKSFYESKVKPYLPGVGMAFGQIALMVGTGKLLDYSMKQLDIGLAIPLSISLGIAFSGMLFCESVQSRNPLSMGIYGLMLWNRMNALYR